MPHQLADLRYARHLTASDAAPEHEGEYEYTHFTGDLGAIQAEHARFSESVFTDVALERGSLRYARFSDVWLRDVRWVGTDVSDTGWQDVEMLIGALAGVDAGGAGLRRVRFEGCKFESVNFRAAVLREVEFVDCVLRNTDFGQAKLTKVGFAGSSLDEIDFTGATLSEVDLRGTRTLRVAGSLEALRGATVSPAQLMDLAAAFARQIGLVVAE
ncbi:pentapeptide repeat-containing protein [Nocardia panacis]|uniref:Pentapeptide repeat-containing protein n=1 Tax=Nocardia panacis TaxID=2340916 RepID=A0A3A4KRB3_9NOCA|nr:pentapeptide repeat-containing protein [Nocardia panacis]RJO78390.1 pentapeptide repeat-containing protein [Nocardia panacis]